MSFVLRYFFLDLLENLHNFRYGYLYVPGCFSLFIWIFAKNPFKGKHPFLYHVEFFIYLRQVKFTIIHLAQGGLTGEKAYA